MFAALLLLFGCGNGTGTTSGSSSSPPSDTSGAVRMKAIFHPKVQAGADADPVLNLEVARTPAERAIGLMRRDSMAPDQGMIFIYDGPTTTPFWMKDTYIPLSIAFIAADGNIVDIQDMAPLTTDPHAPEAPYTQAIEANQGYFSDNGIGVGDSVELLELSN